ncbi:MAG: phospholipase D-like domain-containing protein [Thermoanaerobaculia bacterium]|nr:phospholipase D-like domain-containing protein [Thermoanaerobaculia bacterium]
MWKPSWPDRTPRVRTHGLAGLLRPRAGRYLPRRLRASRVGLLARDLPDGVRDPAFEELIREIDGGSPIHEDTAIEVYFDGSRALEAMLEAVRSARWELLVESYIFTDDSTGRRFARALTRAASRGVDVRVLADAFGSFFTSDRFWREMREGGVQVRLFHRLFRSLWWQPFRDHRKILVADRKVAYTGGMNIANEYVTPLEKLSSEAMRDTHLRLAGAAAWELAAVFAEGWSRSGGPPLPLDEPPDDRPGNRKVLVLDSRPGRGHRETAAVLAASIAAARRSVWLTNGYFAPGRPAVRHLGEVAGRGVDVRLLLPGITDVPVIRHAGHGWYGRLLREGVRIFEYQPAILHAKTLIVDEYLSIVGSTNLDFRSFRFNAECNAVILDPEIGRILARGFRRDLERSVEIEEDSWHRRSLPHRIVDRAAGILTPLL